MREWDQVCGKCGEKKDVEDFSPSARGHNGSYDKVCAVEYSSARNKTPEGKAGRWRYDLKKKYDLTPDQFYIMLAEQDGRCAICGTDEPGGRSNQWHVDHDHNTGRRRKLLCHNCNLGIGMFHDNVE